MNPVLILSSQIQNVRANVMMDGIHGIQRMIGSVQTGRHENERTTRADDRIPAYLPDLRERILGQFGMEIHQEKANPGDKLYESLLLQLEMYQDKVKGE